MGLFFRGKKAAGGSPGGLEKAKSRKGMLGFFVDGVAEMASDAAEGMADLVSDAADAVGDAAESAGTAIYKAADKAADAVGDAATAVAKRVRPQPMPVTEEEVVQRTPAEHWFKPATGWPSDVEAWNTSDGYAAPNHLMPTEKEAPSLFATRIKPVGELRIEVLAAKGLVISDTITRASDPYAVVLFEGYAARSGPVEYTTSPRWHPTKTARAFCFPVTTPYSCAYVSLMDEDYPDPDDPLGRVVLEMGTLISGTEYDAWFPVQMSRLVAPKGHKGWLRLRYSVRYTSERARLLRYVTPPTPKPFIVPFAAHHYLRDATFAYTGKDPPRHYTWRTFSSYLKEICDTVDTILMDTVDATADLMFWRGTTALLSLLVCIGYQYLVSYPRYLPAAMML